MSIVLLSLCDTKKNLHRLSIMEIPNMPEPSFPSPIHKEGSLYVMGIVLQQ